MRFQPIPLGQASSSALIWFFLFFGVIATLVVAGFVLALVKGVSQWRANEASPLRSIDALVVARRTDVRQLVGANRAANTSTTYFVTFEESSRERRELQVNGTE